MASAATLYTPEILALATELADYPLSGAWDASGEAHSPICGSVVRQGLALDREGRIRRIGLQVQACAIGQAAAALYVKAASGRSTDDIAHTEHALRSWLAGEGERPDWPGIDLLDPARAYPARHGAILLPWMSGLRALSLRDAAG